MISVLIDNDANKYMKLKAYLDENNLEDCRVAAKIRSRNLMLKDILKLNYDENAWYRVEANYSQPNDTPSRRRIYEENDKLYDGKTISEINVNTITTKQDRHPNSGVIEYNSGREGRAPYRNLTPRECFLLMGFDEKDYQIVVENNVEVKKNRLLFTREKLIKMAGNSIVVDVLEAIFRQIQDIESIIK